MSCISPATNFAGADPLAASKARTDALIRQMAVNHRRQTIRRGVESYDRVRHLPRVLLNNVLDPAAARAVLNTPRPVIIKSLRSMIDHQRAGLAAKHWWADRNMLIAARQAYVSERLAALRDRATVARLLSDARAA